MSVRSSVAVALALAAGLGGVALAALPAHAGDTGRTYGCAAHWRDTATWNECKDAPPVQVRLNADCNWQPDYTGDWKNVQGTANPVDKYDCFSRANSAWNGYR